MNRKGNRLRKEKGRKGNICEANCSIWRPGGNKQGETNENNDGIGSGPGETGKRPSEVTAVVMERIPAGEAGEGGRGLRRGIIVDGRYLSRGGDCGAAQGLQHQQSGANAAQRTHSGIVERNEASLGADDVGCGGSEQGRRGEKFREGRLEGIVGRVSERAVRLPRDMTARVGEEDVAVVGRGEVDELLPFVFVVEDGNEMALLFGGHVFAHAAENHRSDE
jgi:hypothetical protein